MRKTIILFALMATATLALAQEDRPFEVAGGYQYTRLNSGGDGINLNGWSASFQYNTSESFGLVAEFTGGGNEEGAAPFEVETGLNTFLFGPRYRFKLENEKLKPFVHGLFGGARLDVEAAGVNADDTTFGLALGGGVDYRFNDNFSFRAVQFDYLRTGFGDEGQNNVRLGVGVVFHFGER